MPSPNGDLLSLASRIFQLPGRNIAFSRRGIPLSRWGIAIAGALFFWAGASVADGEKGVLTADAVTASVAAGAHVAGTGKVERSASLLAALDSIQGEALREHVDFLADDARAGREAGAPGGRASGDYLAGQLESLGVRPGGVDGGFFQPFGKDYRNALGILEGSDPERKQEFVVVGAHYDHVGYGSKKTSLGKPGQVHNGADDNASGTSALLELIEAFTLLSEPPARSLLFVFWDAEEKGFLGSKHWIANPTVPLDKVVGSVNIDMIGRLRDDRLFVYGTRFGHGWRRLVSRHNDSPRLELVWPWSTPANSDHWPFLGKGVPSLMAHTGVHEDYHRPSDDSALIDTQGMRRVSRLLFLVVNELAQRAEGVAFREAGRKDKNHTREALASQVPKQPERLGVRASTKPGAGADIEAVTVGSPGAAAGLKPGDRIVELGGQPVRSADALVWAVSAAENRVPIVVKRAGQSELLRLTAQLEGKPMRLGIRWRVDEAEPGAVVLTLVVSGSPAARAGLEPGDYIYQIAGRDFADEVEFARIAHEQPGPIELLVERDGKLRTVVLELDRASLRRAA